MTATAPHLDDGGTYEGANTTERPASARPGNRHKRRLVVADLAALSAGLATATALRYLSGDVSDIDLRNWARVVLLSLPLWFAAAVRLRLYSSRFITSGLDEIRRVVSLAATGSAALAVIGTLLEITVSRRWLVLVFLTVSAFVGAERRIARGHFDRLRREGRIRRRVIIVGCNREALAIHRMFRDEPKLGYVSAGFVDVTGVVIAATAMDLASSNRLIRTLTDRGIHVELSSTLQDVATDRLTVRRLGRFPVVYVEPVQRHGWRALAKRTFDLAGAGLGLVVLAPVAAVAAVFIKLDSPGPVLFRQVRVGRDGERFELWKLRTMVVDAEAQLDRVRHLNISDGPLFKAYNDPRITSVGRILRALSIDEIPQLWNVVRGQMSLVGPRPALPREVEGWSRDLHGRLRVKPGITGMWQVHGRGTGAFELYERLDLYYVDNWSLITDVVIIARTIPSVLARRGAM